MTDKTVVFQYHNWNVDYDLKLEYGLIVGVDIFLKLYSTSKMEIT